MSHLELTNPDNTSGEHKEIFEQINGAFGVGTNMFKAIGNSSAALESMWTSFGALGKGKIAEILAYVALNIFTNYTNVAFDVPLNFPKVNSRQDA